MPSIDDATTAFFAALPIFGDNPVGKATRSALVSRLKGAMPGDHTQPWPQSSGPSFRSIFYPSWTPDPNINVVTAATGLGDDWWRGFSVSSVCQAMSQITSDIRPQLKQPDINNAVNSANAAMRPTLNSLYKQLLISIGQSPASAPYSQIGAGNLAQAAALYQGYLTNPAWISAKNAQFASGQWTNQVWELFHHWIKLTALGVTAAQIDTLIGQLIAAQLPVPPTVAAGAWQGYLPWLTPDSIDYRDLGEATPGILARNCTAYMDAYSCMNEENCYEFTANSQPGNTWRQVPSGSCFLAGTKVLMADNSLKNIENVVAGDQVMTRQGAAQVLAATVLSHLGEQTYSLNGLAFQFTRTHPFLTIHAADGSAGPQMACASPIALMNTCPSLGALGIATLGAGCPPLAGFSNGTVQPVTVTSIQEMPVDPGSIDIYDLVVAFDAQGLSEYIVGDGTNMFVISSETPRFGTAPGASTVLLNIVNNAWPAVQSAMSQVTPDRWLDVLYQGVFAVSTDLVAQAIAQIQGTPLSPPTLQATAALRADVGAHATATVQSLMVSAPADAEGSPQPPVFNGPQGAFFAAVLAVFGEEVDDALNIAWRTFAPVSDTDAEMLAVSALSYELIADADAPAQGNAAVTIGLTADGQSAELPGGQVTLGYAGQIGAVAYFDTWRPMTDGNWQITLGFSDGAGNPLLFGASAPLPQTIDDGYRLFNLELTDPSGNVVGQASLDARPFTVLGMAAEIAARSAWTQQKTEDFTTALADGLAALFTQRFPTAVGPYLHPRS